MKSIKSKFPHCYKLGNIKIFLKEPASYQTQAAILNHIQKTKAGKKIETINFETSLFIKTTSIKKLSAKIRITFNIPRRNKELDIPLADIKNSLDIQAIGVNTPALLGFGYEKRLGLVNKLTIIHENLENHVDGLEWLQEHPQKAVELVEKTFDLILAMHSEKRYHLDLWLRNIMFSKEQPEKLIAIDFEHYISGKPSNKEGLLGFMFGNFYLLELGKFIPEEIYDETMKKFIGKIHNINEDEFIKNYEFSKKNRVSRKNRRQLFFGKISFNQQ